MLHGNNIENIFNKSNTRNKKVTLNSHTNISFIYNNLVYLQFVDSGYAISDKFINEFNSLDIQIHDTDEIYNINKNDIHLPITMYINDNTNNYYNGNNKNMIVILITPISSKNIHIDSYNRAYIINETNSYIDVYVQNTKYVYCSGMVKTTYL